MLAVHAMASLFNLDETREPIVWYMKPLAKCWDVLIDWFSFKKIRSANWKKVCHLYSGFIEDYKNFSCSLSIIEYSNFDNLDSFSIDN